MKSPENGTAELKARHPLNCESKESYVLTIAAVACNGQVSERYGEKYNKENVREIIVGVCSRVIEVEVEDVNEYIPVWSQEEYSAQLEEGEMAERILEVAATDSDCSPQYGDICKYSISGPDQTFAIDQQGVISNTRPLWAR